MATDRGGHVDCSAMDMQRGGLAESDIVLKSPDSRSIRRKLPEPRTAHLPSLTSLARPLHGDTGKFSISANRQIKDLEVEIVTQVEDDVIEPYVIDRGPRFDGRRTILQN